ncbi:RICIN domain-containing protein [Streptomyces lateritius]|uniref:RICIN domain-containing protein n=1 Tax=Streptomyces lateritius TaxID=67313 RepID=A0ABW6YLD3_9ACTN
MTERCTDNDNAMVGRVIGRADGFYNIQNKQDGTCLDADERGGAGSPRSCQLDNTFQRWQIQPSATDRQIYNKANNSCLDSGGNQGSDVYDRDCDSYNAYRRWQVNPA